MEKKSPLVSVLLSIYKVEDYLEECLDSILAQSYKNLEIVCVDNGSPDNCGKILQKYAKKDKRIKIVSLKENRMLCGGRNAGMDHATGEFICFVDPDDWIEPDHIKVMAAAMSTKKDPNGKPYQLVMNTAAYNYYVQPDGEVQILHDYSGKEGNITLEEVNKNPRFDTDIPMWGRLYRRSFLVKHGIRFLEGINTDNIPFTMKALVNMGNFYRLAPKKQARYWRRMITPEGAITEVVLFKNNEIPYALDNLYDYLKEKGFNRQARVFFHLYFTICFPRHQDQPRYCQAYRNLMLKMEDDIKSLPDVYTQSDRDLCNLLIYSSDFFQFAGLYFSPHPHPLSHCRVTRVKLFGFLPVYRKKERIGKRTDYYICGIPVWRVGYKNPAVRKVRLFGFILLWKTSVKEK